MKPAAKEFPKWEYQELRGRRLGADRRVKVEGDARKFWILYGHPGSGWISDREFMEDVAVGVVACWGGALRPVGTVALVEIPDESAWVIACTTNYHRLTSLRMFVRGYVMGCVFGKRPTLKHSEKPSFPRLPIQGATRP